MFFAVTCHAVPVNSSSSVSNQTIPQKVSVVIDEGSPFVNIAFLIRKNVRRLRLKASKISTCFSSDRWNCNTSRSNPQLLRSRHRHERLGVSHTFVLLARSVTNEYAELLRVPLEDIALSFDDLGSRIARIVMDEFPRKTAVEVREIVVERRRISELETLEPTWFLSLAPVYSLFESNYRRGSVRNNVNYDFSNIIN